MKLSDAVDKLRPPVGESSPLLYIKDWHLVLQSTNLPERDDRLPYETLDLFEDDWLNNTLPGEDDYRFCYAGVKGTFTPLHRDVYTSYSWSTNVAGVKRWHFFPPEAAHLLRRNPSYRRSEIIFDVREVDEELFPGWKEARKHEICVEQKAGETIFVPSGWYHQVINLTDCISVNQNWCNSCNLPSLYDSMKDAVLDVADAISDVRDLLAKAHSVTSKQSNLPSTPMRTAGGAEEWKIEWLREVDKLLKMDAGWGWEQFFRMICHNIEPLTMAAPENLRPSISFVHGRVRKIVDDFVLREEYAILPEIRTIVDEVREKLRTSATA